MTSFYEAFDDSGSNLVKGGSHVGNVKIGQTGHCIVTGRSAVNSTGRWFESNWEIMDTMNGNEYDYNSCLNSNT